MIEIIIKYDRMVFFSINNGLANRVNDIFLGAFTLIGYAYFLVPVGFVYLYYNDREGAKRNFILFSITLIVGAIAVQSIKFAVARPRPFKDMEPLLLAGKVHIHNLFYPLKQNSFPSGHTQLAFTVATFLAMVNKRNHLYLFVAAFLVGLSRIYVGVHYPLDVFFGAIVGFLAAFIVVKLSKTENKIPNQEQRMNNTRDDLIHNIAVFGYEKGPLAQGEESAVLGKLLATGSSLWMDTGDRDLALSLWKKEISALTTNNTLANQVVQSGVVDAEIESAIKRIREASLDIPESGFITEIGFIINCKIALRLVATFGKKVSVELHPSMSRDIEKSLYYARRYYKVNPEHFIIKVPLTPEGYLIVRQLSKEGIPINFTLGFSARQNYMAARLSNPDYLNVFLGRLNAVVSDNGLGSGDYVGERVTLATQKAINGIKKKDSAIKTSLIAASVRSGQQVLDLAGVDVLTIPPKAFEELYGLGSASGEIASKLGEVYPVGIDSPEKFAHLWEVDDSFVAFVDTLLSTELDNMDGNGLLNVCHRSGVNIFYPFSQDNIASIKNRGKIPLLSDWGENVAIDDLMTMSALLSFTTDQAALDGRIKGFI